MSDSDMTAPAVRGAVVAEIGWQRVDGSVRGSVHTPLIIDGIPGLALTYADLPVAEELANARRVAVVLTDARKTLRGWQPMVATGPPPELEHDPEGERFLAQDDLVGQELAKYPPSRLRSDSLLQRGENWWYQSRVLARFVGLSPSLCPEARTNPDDGVLLYAVDHRLTAETVRVDDWHADRLRIEPLAGTAPAPRQPSPACLLRHDHSDDLERRATFTLTGRWDGDRFTVATREGQAHLPPVPGVWARIKQAKALERACRRGLRAAGH
ncbi:hypothetical protein ER308_20980 [Egibacter rhizosphaerae]|uniref:Uncharacterized protein n=1 Tax=Egibacter rhizosphaerae TaxID=1670831 RepID=A0A411YKR1_9ACTN|nr:hypothetical protein [Egibacter rhizosphaerae]QBI21785.1 hypothetical protein ER308_20980 [Egibacter rhizosphaerae]